MEHQQLRADEAKGVWDYSISYEGHLFKQRICQPVDSKDFYTYVIHESLENVGGYWMEVLNAISRMDEGPFATLNQAIEHGKELILHWGKNK
jgi:hypothetical protein